MSTTTVIEALKRLLTEQEMETQDDICAALQQLGFEGTQSKVSRLLRKLNAVKVSDEQGRTIYRLPGEHAPPAVTAVLTHLVMDIVHNGQMIVIHTSPGSASLIARLVDHDRKALGVLGTVAGDDTIMIAPSVPNEIEKTVEKISQRLAD